MEPNQENRDIQSIIEYLNSKTGKNFRASNRTTVKHINARLNEGFTLEDFLTVIDNMCQRWLNDPKMADYLRPDTLFRTKFEGYLNMGQRNHYKKYHDLLEEFPEGGEGDAGKGQARIPESFLDVV